MVWVSKPSFGVQVCAENESMRAPHLSPISKDVYFPPVQLFTATVCDKPIRNLKAHEPFSQVQPPKRVLCLPRWDSWSHVKGAPTHAVVRFKLGGFSVYRYHDNMCCTWNIYCSTEPIVHVCVPKVFVFVHQGIAVSFRTENPPRPIKKSWAVWASGKQATCATKPGKLSLGL